MNNIKRLRSFRYIIDLCDDVRKKHCVTQKKKFSDTSKKAANRKERRALKLELSQEF